MSDPDFLDEVYKPQKYEMCKQCGKPKGYHCTEEKCPYEKEK